MSTRSKRSAASAASSYELPATPAKMAKLNNISAAAAIEGKKQQKTVVAEKGRYTHASNTTSGCTLSLSLSVSPSGVKVSECAIADRLCSSGVRPSPRVACSGPGVAGRPWPLSRSFHQWRMGQARGKEDIRHCQPCYWRKTCLHHSGSAVKILF